MAKRKSNTIDYRVKKASDAREICSNYLKSIELSNVIIFGLPEIDDRFDIWRVPLKSKNGSKIGEIVIDAKTSFVDTKKTTN